MAKIEVLKKSIETVYPVTIDEAIVTTKDKKKLSDKLNELDSLLASTTMYYIGSKQANVNSPTINTSIGVVTSKDKLLNTLSHFKIATFKDGKPTHICAPGRLTMDEFGNDVKYDGTDGDVVLYVDVPVYDGKNRINDSTSNASINTLGLGLTPYYIGDGKVAKKYDPFIISADYTQILNNYQNSSTSTKEGNYVAHCFFNPSMGATVNWTTAGPNTSTNKIFKDSYVNATTTKGFPSYVSNLYSSFSARNKNLTINGSTNGVYQGLFYGWNEIYWEAMYMELGTLDITSETNFGMGITGVWPTMNNDRFLNVSYGSTMANFVFPSDYQYKTELNLTNVDDNGYYHMFKQYLNSSICNSYVEESTSTADDGTVSTTSTTKYLANQSCAGGIDNQYGRCLFEELIHLRIFDNITKNGYTQYVDNNDAIFTDTGEKVYADTSADDYPNLLNGTNMDSAKLYFKIRSVPNCQGLKDGVMTAVINFYVKMDCVDESVINANPNYYSLKDCFVIFKLSLPVYRGMPLFKGKYLMLEGIYNRLIGGYYADDEEGTEELPLQSQLRGYLEVFAVDNYDQVGNIYTVDTNKLKCAGLCNDNVLRLTNEGYTTNFLNSSTLADTNSEWYESELHEGGLLYGYKKLNTIVSAKNDSTGKSVSGGKYSWRNMGAAWIKDANYGVSMIDFIYNYGEGAGQHTGECAYLYSDKYSWGDIRVDNTSNQVSGKLKLGYSVVQCTAFGCNADHGIPGRAVNANSSVSFHGSHFGGAFAARVVP